MLSLQRCKGRRAQELNAARQDILKRARALKQSATNDTKQCAQQGTGATQTGCVGLSDPTSGHQQLCEQMQALERDFMELVSV